jgi:flagellar biosynthesis protein FlhB
VAGGEERTEAPTPKRKREARRKGQVARSPDLVMWAQLLAATFLARLTIASGSDRLKGLLRQVEQAIERPEPGTAMRVMGDGLQSALFVVLPLAGGLMVVGIVGHLSQTKFQMSFALLKPKVERVNPMKGLKRLFSVANAWETAKLLLRLTILVAVAVPPIMHVTEALVAVGRLSVGETVGLVGQSALSFVRNVAMAGLVLAAIDYGVQRRRINKSIRMTKQEIKEEYRQSEGDPKIKAAVRERQAAMSRNRMMAAVSTASVIVVNPTHVAVALAYTAERGAPKVVAKGKGEVARRIREEAEKHHIPMVRDVTLARTLEATCKVDQEIPADLYEAVARLLAFVLTLGRRAAVYGAVLPAPAGGF